MARSIGVATVVFDDARHETMRGRQGGRPRLPDERALIVVGDPDHAAWSEDATHLTHCSQWIRHVHQQVVSEGGIEAGIGEREL
jgi:hypothetical protein